MCIRDRVKPQPSGLIGRAEPHQSGLHGSGSARGGWGGAELEHGSRGSKPFRVKAHRARGVL
eukprot:15255702-Alexandrium_andersonii.AAC.1